MKSLHKKLLARNAMALMLSLAITTGSAFAIAPTASAASSSTSKSQTITRNEAVKIAQKKVKDGTLIDAHTSYNKGKQIYIVKILDTGSTLYKFKIDSSSGKIIYTYKVTLNSSKAAKLRAIKSNSNTAVETAKISAETAIEIAKKDSGATILVSCELDTEDGVLVYEIEMTDSYGTEYEWVIDAKSGKVIDFDVDYDD